jgi:hypothetical protein
VTVQTLSPVQAPPITPLRGTLFDAARIIDGLPIGLMSGVVDDIYESWACLRTFNIIADPCAPSNAKVFDTVPWASAIYAVGYMGATCKGPGFSYNDGADKLAALYQAIESKTVAQLLMNDVIGVNGTDLTPGGTPVDPITALGLLEGHAATYYAGVPTIHMGRGVLAHLCQQLDTSGKTFYTCAGSKVAADGNDTRMWVTGEVTVARGELVSVPAMNTTTNDMTFLAERAYLISHDCLDAHVSTDVPNAGHN